MVFSSGILFDCVIGALISCLSFSGFCWLIEELITVLFSSKDISFWVVLFKVLFGLSFWEFLRTHIFCFPQNVETSSSLILDSSKILISVFILLSLISFSFVFDLFPSFQLFLFFDFTYGNIFYLYEKNLKPIFL